ncbi:MAG: MFS transporter [Salinarimonadaceae bacterium]|nr:MAG: MFS transporter [Salinarimonadaceae bacterium]
MRIFLVLLFAYVLSQFYRAFLAIVAGDLSRDLGLDAAQLGALSAIWFATFAIAQFPVGYALDRIGPRRTIAGFMVIAVVGAWLMSAATGYYTALAAMAAIGVGCSPILMGSLYLFARNYPAERFAMLSSFMIGFGSLGNMLGATPLAVAVEAFGWRESMMGIAAITAASTLVCLAILRDPPRAAQTGPGGGMLSGIVEIATLRGVWLIMPFTFVSYAIVVATRGLWIAPYFNEVHGFTTTQTGNAALIMAATMTLGALAYGPIERLIRDPKRTVAIGSFITVICFIAVAFVGEGRAIMAVALIGAIGGFGMTFGIVMAHGRLFFPAHLIGRGVTFLNFASIAGAGVTQWLSGQFIQLKIDSGADPATTYATLFFAFGAALAITLLIYLASPARPKP